MLSKFYANITKEIVQNVIATMGIGLFNEKHLKLLKKTLKNIKQLQKILQVLVQYLMQEILYVMLIIVI